MEVKDVLAAIKPYTSRDRLMEHVERIASYHRIKASTGFRAAARFCADALQEQGIDAQIISWPADGVHRHKNIRTMLEWDIRGGMCQVEGFGRIADFEEEALSILCRSDGCDFRETPLELIYLDRGTDPALYDDIPLENKLVFVRESHEQYAWAMEVRGARGIITDHVLDSRLHARVIQYTSFWWLEEPGEVKYFGFCLTPETGGRLAAYCLEKRARKEPVRATGYIDAAFYPGAMDAATALIPGTADEEILITAHLCHPKPSANDNASGVAAGMEAITALHRAMEAGALPRGRRGVRLLLIPEMKGTIAYLHEVRDRWPRLMAGINLDMVGGSQEEGCGPLVLTNLPRALPSFTQWAAMLALEHGASTITGFNGVQPLPGVNWCQSAYAGGSDHYILSDPTAGIPCPSLGQWPDAFYHTSGDTVDRISPQMLEVSARTCAAFCGMLQQLAPADLPRLFLRGRTRLVQELEGASSPEEGAHLCACHRSAVRDAARFFPTGAEPVIQQELSALDSLERAYAISNAPMPKAPGSSPIPRRLYALPMREPDLAAAETGSLEALRRFEQEWPRRVTDLRTLKDLTQFYLDGRRSAEEVARLVCLDLRSKNPADSEAVAAYLRLLEACRLVAFD